LDFLAWKSYYAAAVSGTGSLSNLAREVIRGGYEVRCSLSQAVSAWHRFGQTPVIVCVLPYFWKTESRETTPSS